jgi:hypothetical protein
MILLEDFICFSRSNIEELTYYPTQMKKIAVRLIFFFISRKEAQISSILGSSNQYSFYPQILECDPTIRNSTVACNTEAKHDKSIPFLDRNSIFERNPTLLQTIIFDFSIRHPLIIRYR